MNEQQKSKNAAVNRWAGDQRMRVEWRQGTGEAQVIGWRRVDGQRAMESGSGDPVFEGGEEFDELWAIGCRDPIPSADEVDGVPERTCSNWSYGCDGETDGAMHGRLTFCPDCEDGERLNWAEFVGDGVKRLPTRPEVEVLTREAARLFRCGCNDVQVGGVARMGRLVVGEVKRPDGLPCGLIAAEW